LTSPVLRARPMESSAAPSFLRRALSIIAAPRAPLQVQAARGSAGDRETAPRSSAAPTILRLERICTAPSAASRLNASRTGVWLTPSSCARPRWRVCYRHDLPVTKRLRSSWCTFACSSESWGFRSGGNESRPLRTGCAVRRAPPSVSAPVYSPADRSRRE